MSGESAYASARRRARVPDTSSVGRDGPPEVVVDGLRSLWGAPDSAIGLDGDQMDDALLTEWAALLAQTAPVHLGSQQAECTTPAAVPNEAVPKPLPGGGRSVGVAPRPPRAGFLFRRPFVALALSLALLLVVGVLAREGNRTSGLQAGRQPIPTPMHTPPPEMAGVKVETPIAPPMTWLPVVVSTADDACPMHLDARPDECFFVG